MEETVNEMSSNKIIILGLDGGSLDVILRGVKEGKLPTFQRIMKMGTHGKLKSVIPPVTAPAWSSFLTGKNPGKHGIYDFYVRKKNSHIRRPVNAQDIHSEVFCEILSHNRKKVGMVNVPMTYPPKQIDGFIVSGMLTPSEENYTYPRSLQNELDSINYEIEISERYYPGNEKCYVDAVHEMIENKRKALFYLMDQFAWNLLIYVFRETDVISHYFWKFQDPIHPQFDEKMTDKYGNSILEVYRKADDLLNEIFQRTDDDVTVFVISDHGFGPQIKTVHVNNWLAQKNYLRFKSGAVTRLKRSLFSHGFKPDRIWNCLAKIRPLFKLMARFKGSRVAEKSFLSFSDVDWKKTVAYVNGGGGSSYTSIYINKRGREPEDASLLTNGYESLREEIIDGLSQLTDPETKEEIVDVVYKKEDIYKGGNLKEAPDIVVKWKYGYVAYPYFTGGGRITTKAPLTRSGVHRIDGIFFAYGPGIAKGKIVKNAEIIDLAPTILHMMNIRIPRDMDGKVLREIFKPNSELAGKRVKYHARKERIVLKTKVWADGEEEKVKRRLKELGYI